VALRDAIVAASAVAAEVERTSVLAIASRLM